MSLPNTRAAAREGRATGWHRRGRGSKLAVLVSVSLGNGSTVMWKRVHSISQMMYVIRRDAAFSRGGSTVRVAVLVVGARRVGNADVSGVTRLFRRGGTACYYVVVVVRGSVDNVSVGGGGVRIRRGGHAIGCFNRKIRRGGTAGAREGLSVGGSVAAVCGSGDGAMFRRGGHACGRFPARRYC